MALDALWSLALLFIIYVRLPAGQNLRLLKRSEDMHRHTKEGRL